MLSVYREWIKTRREKKELLKNISKDYIKIEKKFIQFFQDKSFWPKQKPLWEAGGQKKKFLKNISKGDMKKGSAKGMKKQIT